ncbi:hypothetical protein EC844_1562 [Acinetobacter calcoaceticus]|uniref:Uncharacterized protein n=1 Tax=Acinetobacter calcoaceticus TaxID=471 RepID=A0A4R1XEI7_ACICA|nr:hypothetical protein EC844_1562 [Acinetobacter calcoaceticus]
MGKKMKFLVPIIFLIMLLTECDQGERKPTAMSNHPINIELKNQARTIFNDKLENEQSYRSYSSNDVFYEIKAENLTMEQFELYKNQILPKNGWVFFSKVEQAYLFCQGTRQLEMIPPQILVGNKVLGEGDIGRQLVDQWNIIFSHTANGTLNQCYKYNR